MGRRLVDMIGIYMLPINSNVAFLIDKDDYNLVSQFKWYRVKDHNGSDYFRYQASAKINGILKTFPLHRLVMNFPTNLVDHINRDTSDNRKSNLRETSRMVNSTNCKMHKTNKTGYRGVCKRGGKFISQISVNGKKIYLGIFENLQDAVDSYQSAIKKYKPFMDL